MKLNPNEIKIIIEDYVKGKNISLEYILSEPHKRLTRAINENVKLVAEFFPNPFGSNGSFVYAVVKDDVTGETTTHLMENSKEKFKSREDYIQNQRPKIFSYVAISQILRINFDLFNLFENEKTFKIVG